MMPTDHTSPLPDPPHPNRAGARVILCGGSTCKHRHESLNGPTGCCPTHGAYLYYCSECHDERRSLRDEAPGNSRSFHFSPHESGG